MRDIELSYLPRTADTADRLKTLLADFERQGHTRVKLRQVLWSRFELTRFAIDRQGPDVSEVGATWVDDLVATNALRPFSPADLRRIGPPEAFIPASWQAGHIGGSPQVWTIPWLAEPYVIHYRKDLLAQAGVDEMTAFQSHRQIGQTVKQLQASGVGMPVAAPVLSKATTYDYFCILQALCSWVWAQGTDFCSADGKRVLLDQPDTLAALHDYFELYRSLSPDGVPELMEIGHGALFRQGGAAMTFGTMTVQSPWDTVPAAMRDHWGVAAFPQTGLVGGSNLVIWSYSLHNTAAMDLVQFLTCDSSLVALSRPLHTLPSRMSALADPTYQDDPQWKEVVKAARQGRSSPRLKLWGLIEERLLDALYQIADDVLANRDADLDLLIRRRIEPLASRLNVTLMAHSGQG